MTDNERKIGASIPRHDRPTSKDVDKAYIVLQEEVLIEDKNILFDSRILLVIFTDTELNFYEKHLKISTDCSLVSMKNSISSSFFSINFSNRNELYQM